MNTHLDFKRDGNDCNAFLIFFLITVSQSLETLSFLNHTMKDELEHLENFVTAHIPAVTWKEMQSPFSHTVPFHCITYLL